MAFPQAADRPSFTLEHCNGNSGTSGLIRLFARAIQAASKISDVAMLQFDDEQLIMLACSGCSTHAVKFTFHGENFFTEYNCGNRQRCLINVKSLYAPFKAPYISEKYASGNSMKSSGLSDHRPTKIKCELIVAPEYRQRNGLCNKDDNKLVFTIATDRPETEPQDSLTYHLLIRAFDDDNRKLFRVERFQPSEKLRLKLSPRCGNGEKFLITGLINFADVEMVTITSNNCKISFIGIGDPFEGPSNISEFSHDLTEFRNYTYYGDISTQMQLRQLKTFLSNIENCRGIIEGEYVFEESRAHFIYKFHHMSAQYTTSTTTYSPDPEYPLAIESGEQYQAKSISETDINGERNSIGSDSSSEYDDGGFQDEVGYELDNEANGYQANESDDEFLNELDDDSSQFGAPSVINESRPLEQVNCTANSVISLGRNSRHSGHPENARMLMSIRSEESKVEPMPEHVAIQLFNVGDSEPDEDEVEDDYDEFDE